MKLMMKKNQYSVKVTVFCSATKEEIPEFEAAAPDARAPRLIYISLNCFIFGQPYINLHVCDNE